MKVLIVLHDAPYGTERSYNGLRLAKALARRDGVEVHVFMFGDAVISAMANQKTPDGYYNVGHMVQSAARHGAAIGMCGSCMDARGITESTVVEGAKRSSLEEMADWMLWADKVLSF
jgi:uncharacterized protein involved in oxidation of intracellular sulfur